MHNKEKLLRVTFFSFSKNFREFWKIFYILRFYLQVFCADLVTTIIFLNLTSKIKWDEAFATCLKIMESNKYLFYVHSTLAEHNLHHQFQSYIITCIANCKKKNKNVKIWENVSWLRKSFISKNFSCQQHMCRFSIVDNFEHSASQTRGISHSLLYDESLLHFFFISFF